MTLRWRGECRRELMRQAAAEALGHGTVDSRVPKEWSESRSLWVHWPIGWRVLRPLSCRVSGTGEEQGACGAGAAVCKQLSCPAVHSPLLLLGELSLACVTHWRNLLSSTLHAQASVCCLSPVSLCWTHCSSVTMLSPVTPGQLGGGPWGPDTR